MSMYQADIVVNDILGREVVPADYRAVPRVTFTDPEIGSVGLSEREARDQGLEVRVGRAELPTSTRGWIHKAGNQGFIKLVEDADRGVLVGATSVGPWGARCSGLLTLAVHAEVPTDRPPAHDLRLPDVPPGHRGRGARTSSTDEPTVGARSSRRSATRAEPR